MFENIDIVIDTGFGDCGKGLMTGYLSGMRSNPIVIRFSGGQQAGHTVIKDNIKHIFSNFGSGTLNRVPSFFDKNCTIYPIGLVNEYLILNEKGFNPTLYIHPLAMITTPYDVAFNRITEKKNGHGSCGVGVAATMKRTINTGYKLHAVDFNNRDILFQKLFQIKEYYSKLASELNLKGFHIELSKWESNYFECVEFIIKNKIFQIEDYNILYNFNNLIFEGSQGVLLDMDHGIFPNVTYGNTTCKNAIEICKYFKDIKSINKFYVTRCYQTRHGNGWMSNQKEIKLINNEEEINITHEYQGNFKIGEIDYNLINHSILVDSFYNDNYEVNNNLLVTCLDQREDFEFDYDSINNIKDFEIYNSCSPISEKIFIKN
jgi:adenylosuccinate synthase